MPSLIRGILHALHCGIPETKLSKRKLYIGMSRDVEDYVICKGLHPYILHIVAVQYMPSINIIM